jgi:hypothetical protein
MEELFYYLKKYGWVRRAIKSLRKIFFVGRRNKCTLPLFHKKRQIVHGHYDN